ncbi:MAG: methyltransferase domain-containing protein [Candidatus Rokubacteria bacterium]|nr:methyltransferase domain-containing protein [Candidatus Rokubacteria bacterium]MBI3826457.1 methyltransferase domain-containing protein [Candidatus Rokubacteria bacterium]
MATHRDAILDQFTRQAVPFSTAPGIRDEEALRLVVEASDAGPEDTVLDVACGPGLVTCAFARVVKHTTGLDLTPAMLERARTVQREQGLTNMTWQQGEAIPLPYPEGAFTIVVSRFAFHHFLDPAAALTEMRRVCAQGGRVVVVDSAPAPDKADAFNAMEVLRDPSHVRAMAQEELRGLFHAAGLPEPRVKTYRLEGEVEGLLKRSFPNPGDDEKIRTLFAASVADDALGVGARPEGGEIRFGYPVAVLVADRG